MIQLPEVMPLLLTACPSFEPSWNEYQAKRRWVTGFIPELDHFAEHIACLLHWGETTELENVMAVLDRVRREGDQYHLRLAVTQSFLSLVSEHGAEMDVSPHLLLSFVPTTEQFFWRLALEHPKRLEIVLRRKRHAV